MSLLSGSRSKMSRQSCDMRDLHEYGDDDDYKVTANVRLDPKYVTENLDCFTYLCKQLVKCNDGALENRIKTCQLSVEEIKSETEKCESSMRIINRDVDVILSKANSQLLCK